MEDNGGEMSVFVCVPFVYYKKSSKGFVATKICLVPVLLSFRVYEIAG